MTALRTITAFAACLLLGTTTGAGAQSVDGAWTGQITCVMLIFTAKAAMEMTVANGQASYSGSRGVGTESGSGAVAADGDITLTGSGTSAAEDKPRYTYTASYSGKISGGAATLKGTQAWSFDGKTENRACSIALERNG